MTDVVIDVPIDPVEGGSANDYDYCNGDPVHCWDLNGAKPKSRPLSPAEQAMLGRLISDCSGPDPYGADIYGSALVGVSGQPLPRAIYRSLVSGLRLAVLECAHPG